MQKLNREKAQGYFNKVGPQSGASPRLELSNSKIQLSTSLIKMNFLTIS